MVTFGGTGCRCGPDGRDGKTSNNSPMLATANQMIERRNRINGLPESKPTAGLSQHGQTVESGFFHGVASPMEALPRFVSKSNFKPAAVIESWSEIFICELVVEVWTDTLTGKRKL